MLLGPGVSIQRGYDQEDTGKHAAPVGVNPLRNHLMQTSFTRNSFTRDNYAITPRSSVIPPCCLTADRRTSSPDLDDPKGCSQGTVTQNCNCAVVPYLQDTVAMGQHGLTHFYSGWFFARTQFVGCLVVWTLCFDPVPLLANLLEPIDPVSHGHHTRKQFKP